MLRIMNVILLGVATLALLACEKTEAGVTNEPLQTTQVEQQAPVSSASKAPATVAVAALPASQFKTVYWTDLMPKDDLDALLNPPSYVTDVEDGSFEDQISSQIQSSIAAASDDRYQQALNSARIIVEMDGQAIRIPGFVVPLEFDDEQTITQFFLVPYFGACIHVPPPPPNQIIFVDYPKGFKLEALYQPFWIWGVLKTSLVENDMATAAYSLQMQSFELYEE